MQEKSRYFLELSYKGTAYHGWQVQPNAITVQEVLDKALTTLLRQKIETLGCGRTDSGVHATQFFAHFDCFDQIDNSGATKLINSLNSILPFDIAAKRIIQVAANAHARFDAVQRAYEYHIHYDKNPFKRDYSWLFKDELNVGAMNLAARELLNYDDFSCFSKSNTQVFTNNCSISKALWEDHGDGLTFKIAADRFLRNMVRAIVGTLIEIGKEKMPANAIHHILASKNRSMAGTSVPACGLYLTKVEYPYLS